MRKLGIALIVISVTVAFPLVIIPFWAFIDFLFEGTFNISSFWAIYGRSIIIGLAISIPVGAAGYHLKDRNKDKEKELDNEHLLQKS